MGDGPGRRARSIYAFGRSESCEPTHEQSRTVFRQYLPLRDSNLPSKKSPGIGEGIVSEIPLRGPARPRRLGPEHCGRSKRLCDPDAARPVGIARVRSGKADDIEWHAGQFTVQGKGRKITTMPLPHDVGAAIAAYLQHGRPHSDRRRLFLLAVAPYSRFKGAAGIQTVARSAMRRAGIVGPGRRGSHIFRHSLATDLLRSGATLTEIGQLLRHEQQDRTRI